MHHPMRRADRRASDEQILSVLERAEYAVLSLVGPDGEPYGVPLSFVFVEKERAILFHAARGAGRKLECVAAHREANLPAHCVAVADVRTVPEKFTSEYLSVMISGPVEILEDREEKIRALLALCAKYAPEYGEKAMTYAKDFADKVDVVRLKVEEMTGKGHVKKPKA